MVLTETEVVNFLVGHLNTFLPWGLWGQGAAVLLLVQVFPDGQQINNAHFSRHSKIKLNINKLFT